MNKKDEVYKSDNYCVITIRSALFSIQMYKSYELLNLMKKVILK